MLTDYRVRQREYLLAISRAITAQLDLEEVLRLILRSAVEILSGRAGIIALRSEVSEFSIRAAYGIPASKLPNFYPLMAAIPDPLQGSDHSNIPDFEQKIRQAAQESGLGNTQAVALPLTVRASLLGVLFVFRSGSSSFSINDRQIVRSFADQAAIAVHNAQLYHQIYQEKQRLNAILESSADGVMILNPANKIVVFNEALSQLTGLSPQQAIGKHHDEIIHLKNLTTEYDLEQAFTHGWPQAGSPPLYVEGDLEIGKKHSVSVGITYAALWLPSGQLGNLIANFRDITRFREAEEMKSTFISVVSHELKTPVALIKGYAGTLRRKDARWDAETLDESLAVIEEESDHLNELISNLLDASRLQAGALRLDMGFVHLDRLAASLVEKFRTQTTKHILTADFPPDFPAVPGDTERLRQVLSNLLNNAIKYSTQGGSIQIAGRVLPDHVLLTVQDEGIGIPSKDRERIFERFTRLDNALSRKTQGTGLGLYLVKAIVQAHGGRVWVESAPNETGAIFYVSLPRD